MGRASATASSALTHADRNVDLDAIVTMAPVLRLFVVVV
jgi:hypothetical protein